MLYLGLDTSGKTASVALYDSEADCLLGQISVYTARTHSQVILPYCRQLTAAAGKQLSDIDCFAVAVGPGSYTGLRIGISAVQAMAFALHKPCAGVSTLEGLAANLQSFRGEICAVMTARQTLVYAARFASDGASLRRLSEDTFLERRQLCQQLSGRKLLLCGDGAVSLCEANKSEEWWVAAPNERLQSAAGICLAARNYTPQPPESLRASYLQLTQAEQELSQRQKEQENKRNGDG